MKKIDTNMHPYTEILYQDLQDDAMCFALLNEALKEGENLFLCTLDHVIKARGGYDRIIDRLGLSERAIKKILSGNERLDHQKITRHADTYQPMNQAQGYPTPIDDLPQ